MFKNIVYSTSKFNSNVFKILVMQTAQVLAVARVYWQRSFLRCHELVSCVYLEPQDFLKPFHRDYRLQHQQHEHFDSASLHFFLQLVLSSISCTATFHQFPMEKCLPLVLVQDQRGAPYILQLMRFFNVSLWTRNNSFLQVIHSNPMHSSYMLSKACSVFRFEITELTKQGLSGQMSIMIMSASTGFH